MFCLSFSVPQLSLDAVVGTDDDLVSFSIHLGGWVTCPLSEGGGATVERELKQIHCRLLVRIPNKSSANESNKPYANGIGAFANPI